MFRIDIITLFAAFGAFQGIIFSLILWFRKKTSKANKIFALLLFSTSIRIAKNIIVHAREIDPDWEMPFLVWRILIKVGLTFQFAIGPLFVLYFLARLNPKFKVEKKHLWHFLPFVLLLVTVSFQPWAFWQHGALLASYISILSYYLWAFWIYRHAFKNTDNDQSIKWLRNLLIVTGILLFAYSPALFKYIGYIGGAVLYAIGIYLVSALVLGKDRFFSYFQQKYPGSSIQNGKSKELLEKLNHEMKVVEVFLDSDLSLLRLSKQIGVSTNSLSQLINVHFHKNFTDYINAFRIEKSKQLLLDPSNNKTKVIAIAFDCGFKSLSTFNTVFKKFVGVPPNQFRKENS